MAAAELKLKIGQSIQAFSEGSLTANALHLFQTLGYNTERQAPLDKPTYTEFKENYIQPFSPFNETKALVGEWKYVDLLFQLSKEEVLKQTLLFTTKKVDRTAIEAYLFFTIELSGDHYSRTDLAHITREVNRLFAMPVMILFKHSNLLTLSVINRRLHKRDDSKDVLEKVTLIKDIQIQNPHRAHIEILFDLSFDELKNKYSFTNFVELHNAWQKTLDTRELNKRFYRELANWYFWAVQNVEFPADSETERDLRNATNVIRLITRFIFVWFLKEKGLIPDELFSQNRLRQILKYTDDNNSTYYKAVLQNLFFATLNTEMGKRQFRNRAKKTGDRDQHYMIHNVFRYEDYFAAPEEILRKYFANIPFLNGGLFECLDKRDEITGKQARTDGFSDRKDNVLRVPDELFFSDEQAIDLNNIYGTKNKTYMARGIINLLNNYKFTIDENTPVEEEVALDPELLGKVFENLLASYNPETGSTARKQTGSFYTPREIVNYMVDESLIAYLQTKLTSSSETIPSPLTGEGQGGGELRLRHLLSYTDEPHQFNPNEVEILIDAIDSAKILDPACGSGAFPMGVLHKLVYILGKLDQNNYRWRQRQINKVMEVPDVTVREKLIEDIEQTFQSNELDYGRKLYLIENAIFGVDIQPIAVQIAKLRFFISLIVDQKINTDKDNLGIRPLPNLETKFVAANTLIGIERPQQLTLRNPDIDKKEAELKKVRERHFTARTPQTKEKYRKEDERLRTEISELLSRDGFTREVTEMLAKWNPYDQNASAGFFDPEWMFGMMDGFDIVIGNPPYFNVNTINRDLYDYLSKHYPAIHTGYNDIVYYFIYMGIELLKEPGCCALITSNYYLGNEYARKLRAYLNDHATKIINFKDHMVFDAASIHTSISISQKKATSDEIVFFESTTDKKITSSNIEAELRSFAVKRSELKDNWIVADQSNTSIFEKLKQGSVLLDDIAIIEKGSTSGKNDIFTVSYGFAIKTKMESAVLRKNIKNGDIDRYIVHDRENFLIYVDNNTTIEHFPNVYSYLKKHKDVLSNRNEAKQGLYPWYRLERPRNKAVFDANEKIVVPYRAENNRFAYDNDQYFNDGGDIRAIVINNSNFNIKYVLAILNSELLDWFYGFIGKPKGKVREYFNKPLSLIPIKRVPLSEQKPFITLVDKILAAKQNPPSPPFAKGGNKEADTAAIERQIDEMVYKLYDLTPDEIEIVEGRS